MNLGELVTAGVPVLATGLLVFVRLGGMLAVAPVLGHRSLPLQHRAGLSLLLTLLVTPTIEPARQVAVDDTSALAVAAAGELLVGIAIGFVAVLALAAVESAGELIGTQMGFGFTGLFDPSVAAHRTAVDRLQSLIAVLLLLSLNGHHLLIQGVASSFARIPPGTVTGVSWVASRTVALGAHVFRSGLELAAPVLGLLLAVNIGLALLNRVAPQTNVFVVGLPLTIGLGLIGLVETFPALAGAVARLTGAMATSVDAVLAGASHAVR